MGQKNDSQNISTYSIVDTGQDKCFDNSTEINCPKPDEDFYGQDANYNYNQFSYTDNGDGTITDNNTGLIWQQSADLDGDGSIYINDKMPQDQAEDYCSSLEHAGKEDWRLPNIKTLYSLMNFKGEDPSAEINDNANPFISTTFFDFAYGDNTAGERDIDSQWATSSIYVSEVMNGKNCMFGLNLADGRIKCYPLEKNFYVKCVRDKENYGQNNFRDNEDNTIFDEATGLTWQKKDNGEDIEWEEALAYCNQADTGGYDDWRLPNAKELHSIVDYSRSPDTTDSPSLDPIFNSTSIINEDNQKDWGFYWSSTTHMKTSNQQEHGVYISFGRALGYMNGNWFDVHGAGAQRSSPKILLDIAELPEDPQNQYQVIDGAITHGPQGDVVRSKNFVRCVRGVPGTYNGEASAPSDDSTDLEYIVSDHSNQQSNNQQPDNEQLKSSPQEAINACTSKNELDTCIFQAPNGSVDGICRIIEETLACVPKDK
ncbi:DUF1566 domain-containing protein [Candidatus Dojkabacteria bacterium]|nr:DUF1566 domain-containing protein [Candidatus Dojkabacteria bacterium]